MLAMNGHLEGNKLPLNTDCEFAPNIYAARRCTMLSIRVRSCQRILPCRKSNTKARSMLTHIENALNAFQVQPTAKPSQIPMLLA
jgi:hypothetical protein